MNPMSTADSPFDATSQKDDQEEYSATESGDEVSHLSDDEASERGGPSRRKSKRARTVKSKSTAPRKKYVKGKQGALQGMMKMPIEVFTEIAYHITPPDLITLIRTNKFFRAMLLRRSSILIWQRAQANMPELPPCPTGMSEPQYAALVFSKFCTLCGASASAKPDPWLRVRLCASCRDTKLHEVGRAYNANYNFVAKSHRIKTTKLNSRRGNITIYCISEELDEVCRLREELYKKGDYKVSGEWEQERREKLSTQNAEAEQLRRYIDSVAESRAHELGDLKAERREQVHERLKALGWDEKYLDFKGGEFRQWNSLVDVPKSLTERIWNNLLPKLTPLLEANQTRIDDNEKRLRRHDRLEKVKELICQFKRDTHPYQSIVDALGLTIPAVKAPFNPKEVLDTPFPAIDSTVEWDFIKTIYEEENSLERVEELFNQRRGQVNDKVLKWREEAENQLVKQYLADGDGTGSTDRVDPIVLVNGSTEATKHLSPSARFLLRADTVFIRQTWLKDLPPEDRAYARGISARHFPAMISTFKDPDGGGPYNYDISTPLDEYVRHTGVEKIVKILLKDMGMPDVAHIELRSKKEAFMCGRCYKTAPSSWEDLLAHYQVMERQWVGGKHRYYNYSTRHPVIIRNLHDMTSQLSTKPLAHMLSEDERKASTSHATNKKIIAWCLICSGIDTVYQGARDSMELMQEHMRETHDITADLVQGLHYTKELSSAWRHSNHLTEWQQEWDACYDAQRLDDAAEAGPEARSPGAAKTASQ